jgi:hypothetical protein
MFIKRCVILAMGLVNWLRLSLLVTLASGLVIVWCLAQSSALSPSTLDYRAGSLVKDEPQAVYHADPNDCWNRIFYCLFTRTVHTRLSNDFKADSSFKPIPGLGFPHLPVSTRSFARIESGDRAIEPLYPSFLSSKGAFQGLAEPRYSQLRTALSEALGEKSKRSMLHRALMQSDVWAAYDYLSHNFSFEGEDGKEQRQRRDHLLFLLARFIKQLALAPQEIEALPDNYGAAAKIHHLPNVFTSGEWMEVRWLPGRMHDTAAGHRRAARVFFKPSTMTADKMAFLNGLRDAPDKTKALDSVALVIQNLVIDSNGEITPTRLTYEVQFRTFIKDTHNTLVKTELSQLELSRQLLLANTASGGLIALDDNSPAYLPDAGNDYSFASPQLDKEPILVPLRTRCVSCHAQNASIVFTFNMHARSPVPPVMLLNPLDNDHNRYVAARKRESADFKALQKLWAQR